MIAACFNTTLHAEACRELRGRAIGALTTLLSQRWKLKNDGTSAGVAGLGRVAEAIVVGTKDGNSSASFHYMVNTDWTDASAQTATDLPLLSLRAASSARRLPVRRFVPLLPQLLHSSPAVAEERRGGSHTSLILNLM